MSRLNKRNRDRRRKTIKLICSTIYKHPKSASYAMAAYDLIYLPEAGGLNSRSSNTMAAKLFSYADRCSTGV